MTQGFHVFLFPTTENLGWLGLQTTGRSSSGAIAEFAAAASWVPVDWLSISRKDGG